MDVSKKVVLWLDVRHAVQQVDTARVFVAKVAVADWRSVRDEHVCVLRNSFERCAACLASTKSKRLVAALRLPRCAVKLVAKAFDKSVVQQRKAGRHARCLVSCGQHKQHVEVEQVNTNFQCFAKERVTCCFELV